jgi:hypothetical protein
MLNQHVYNLVDMCIYNFLEYFDIVHCLNMVTDYTHSHLNKQAFVVWVEIHRIFGNYIYIGLRYKEVKLKFVNN